jgi:parallel beta-helix repeat protein
MNRAVFASLTILCLLSVSSITGLIQVVKAEDGTIYIRADGSIYPPTAPVSTLDNMTYTLTGNITSSSDGIMVERDNIIIDGDQYTVQGAGTSIGINVTGRSNVTVKNTTIGSFVRGIYLYNTNRTTISGNNITNNAYGIWLGSSPNVSISGNNITATSEYGIWLGSSSNVSISGNNITANISYGIYLASSSNNSISGNTIANNLGWGLPASGGMVLIYSSNNNSIFGNRLTNSSMGVRLYGCSKTSISGNNITANGGAINLEGSSNNTMYHNDFSGNAFQVSSDGSPNTWDDGYPSGGNYWSDYNGTDVKNGSYQNETGSDGIGDTPYAIAANNTDDYPLMGTPYSFTIEAFPPWSNMSLTIISNSSVTNPFFIYAIPPFWSLEGPELPLLVFSVNGGSGAVCFCRLIMPEAFFLNSSTYMVFVDAQPINATVLTQTLNSSQAYLYFTYTNSTHQVVVTVPEFSSTLILPLFMIATLLAVMVYRKKGIKTTQS